MTRSVERLYSTFPPGVATVGVNNSFGSAANISTGFSTDIELIGFTVRAGSVANAQMEIMLNGQTTTPIISYSFVGDNESGHYVPLDKPFYIPQSTNVAVRGRTDGGSSFTITIALFYRIVY